MVISNIQSPLILFCDSFSWALHSKFAYENKTKSFRLGKCYITCCIFSSDHTKYLPKIILIATYIWLTTEYFTHLHFWLYCICFSSINPPSPQVMLEVILLLLLYP
jgi:hypothetical protein